MSGSSRRVVGQIAAATSKHRTNSTAAVSSVTASPHNITTDHTAPQTQRTEAAAAADQSIRQWEDLPGPLSLPLIGSSYALFFGKPNRAQLHEKSVRLARQYGPVVKLTMGPERSYGISCPKLVSEIVRHEDPVPIRESPLPWTEYVRANNAAGALLTSQGDEWLRKRQAVRSLMLKPASMHGMCDMIEDVCTDMCTHITTHRDTQGYIEQLPQHLYRFSFEAIVAVLYGERMGCLNSGLHDFGEKFIDSVDVILQGCFNPLAVLAPQARKYNTKLWQRHEQAWNNTQKSASHLMDKLVRRVTENNNSNNNVIALSLLTNPKLSNEDILFMMMEFLFGGVDTTANTMGFLLHCLAANPDKQEKLRSEIDSVIKESNSGHITAEDINKLKYFNSCLKETLRLYPILFINGRRLTSDFVSQNHNIQFKKNDMTMFFFHAINRNSDIWERADEFIPERFDRELTDASSPGRQLISMPFGFGTRGCIGKRLAEMELSQLTVKILERYELRLGDKYEYKPITRAVFTPGVQIPVRFIDRLHR